MCATDFASPSSLDANQPVPWRRTKVTLVHRRMRGPRVFKGGCATTDRFSIPNATDARQSTRLRAANRAGAHENDERLDAAISRMAAVEFEQFHEFYY